MTVINRPRDAWLRNALDVADVMKIALRFHSEYGSVIKGWLGGKLYVFFADPRDIEIVLSSPVHIDKSPDYKFFKPWLGDGLLISTGKSINAPG